VPQEADLNDAVLFRLELDSMRKDQVFLEVSLNFAEYSAADVTRGRPAPKLAAFEPVSKKTFVFGDVFSHGLSW
jgi:hypothetical protein